MSLEEGPQVVDSDPREDALFFARENARVERLVRERVDASVGQNAVDLVHHGVSVVRHQHAHSLWKRRSIILKQFSRIFQLYQESIWFKHSRNKLAPPKK